jgi:D-alanine-D-alanine ligase
MMSPRRTRPLFERVLVITGDHGLPDPTKAGSQYADVDFSLHARMREALEGLPNYRFEFLSDHGLLLDRIEHDPPDFVLNFCDTGFRNDPARELHVPALLELYDVPYSGAPPAGMVLAYDKSIVRLIAQSEGIPVPRELFLRPGQSIDDVEPFFPALLKPCQGDGSVGITQDAVVHDEAQARACLASLRRLLPHTPVLYQEYLPGPEYGLALLGNPGAGFTSLPMLEVDFSRLPEGLSPILSFESKTMPDSPYWTDIHFRPAALPATTVGALRRGAARLFERIQCRDYGRFDFRTGADGIIKLMEVNPNPAWDPEAKLAIMAGFAGQSYAEMLAMLLEIAQTRVAGARRVAPDCVGGDSE